VSHKSVIRFTRTYCQQVNDGESEGFTRCYYDAVIGTQFVQAMLSLLEAANDFKNLPSKVKYE